MTVRDVACVSVRAVGAASTQGPSPSTLCRHCDAGQPLPLPEKPALQQRDNDGAERGPNEWRKQWGRVHSERVVVRASCVDRGIYRRAAPISAASDGKRRASSAHANLAHPAVDYLLRVYEDMPWFTEHFPPNVHTWDQAMMDDMVRVEHCARAHAQPAPSPHARVGCVCRWSRWARAMWFRGRCWERTLPTQHKASEPLLVPWKHASGSQTSLFHWSPAQTTGSQCEGNVAGAARLALRSARAAWRQRRD